ncbi:MAG: inositol monophosphatase [Pseudomonadales bacterium]|nr:inositol monophosphatase [Pseudomonadales bacterium]
MEPMINVLLKIARNAGEKLVRATDNLDRLKIEEKKLNDYVTEMDRAIENDIIYNLRKAYPDHAFLGEEGGMQNSVEPSDYLWVIDPIDGTTNYIRGIPHYAISIACFYKGKPEHGIVLNPATREEFTASRGRGAQLNGKRIRVSNRKSLDGALLGTGIPFSNHQQDRMEDYLKTLGELASNCAGIRRPGSAALDLAYVAAGRFDAFWEMGLQKWDMAAGVLLVLEAGGLVADFNGGNTYMESGNIVCGTPRCFKEVLKIVNQHMVQKKA